MTYRKLLGTMSVLLLSVATVGGCTSRFQTYCQAEADCVGGNVKDVDACVAATDGSEEAAAAYDCSDSFSKLAECLDKTGNCQQGMYTFNCGNEATALVSCQDAASAR